MTATSFRGLPVVSDTPTLSSMVTRRTGEPIFWRQTRELTLADGTIVYGCLHCDKVFDRKLQVRPHLLAHKDLKTPSPKVSLVREQERTIAVLGAELDRVEKRARRALDAERSAKAETRKIRRELDSIRSFLAPPGV